MSKGFSYTVYMRFADDDSSFLLMDAIIKAGIKAIGLEGAELEEVDFQDTYDS